MQSCYVQRYNTVTVSKNDSLCTLVKSPVLNRGQVNTPSNLIFICQVNCDALELTAAQIAEGCSISDEAKDQGHYR